MKTNHTNYAKAMLAQANKTGREKLIWLDTFRASRVTVRGLKREKAPVELIAEYIRRCTCDRFVEWNRRKGD